MERSSEDARSDVDGTSAFRGQTGEFEIINGLNFPNMKSLLTALTIVCSLTGAACNYEVSQPPSTVQVQAPSSDVPGTATSNEPSADKPAELTMLPGPNAVPQDTRIVVNIPAFRMDVFKDGMLVKSYRIGIGYVDYPLPTGFRKAEMIIFNPTWTQPNEPWASNPGEVVAAGAPGNPLGPIKVPIGGANLIHGGKPLSKIGTFASHGCVGMTNNQVKDFAKVLADATRTELSLEKMAAYLKRPTRTQVVKLSQVVGVELRYETIVVENGRVRIFRDVYRRKTNTEENLRAVLEAHGVSFDGLAEEEKSQLIETLNIVSGRAPKKPTPTPAANSNQSAADRAAAAAARRAEAERLRKLRRQRDFEVSISALSGKGYPATVNLSTGAGDTSVIANVVADTPAVPRPRPSPPNRIATPTPSASPSSQVPAARPSPARSTATPQPRTSPTPERSSP